MSPRVSVVMPVHNGARFVSQAVASVLTQTLGDLELVVIDDASSDQTPQILATFAHTDPRVRIHRLTKNVGAAAARNIGMAQATSDLVAVMDADDVSLPTRLEAQSGYLAAHPDVGVLGTFAQVIDQDGVQGAVKTYPTSPGLAAWSLFFCSSICHPTVMVRRPLLLALNGYATDCQGGTEDFELWSRASISSKVANYPEVLLLYRIWGGNMTATKWEAQELDADRIVRDSVRRLTGADCGAEMARALRGLATERYPRRPEELRRVGDMIEQLCEAFLQHRPMAAQERGDVSLNAGVKLAMLGALAARRSPTLAARLLARSTRVDSRSAPAFAAKAARHLGARLAARF